MATLRESKASRRDSLMRSFSGAATTALTKGDSSSMKQLSDGSMPSISQIYSWVP